MPDDEMVEQADIEQPPGGQRLSGEVQIVW